MKQLLALIIILGGGYVAYTHKDELLQKYAEFRGEKTAAVPAEATTSPGPAAPAKPAFESKIEATPLAPGEKHLAPIGTFYMLDRASTMTDDGIVAVNPGEPVKLLQQLPGDRMKVVAGKNVFEIKKAQATNDLDLAREAEKKDFVAHGGKL
jgi:hypothetical protein